MVPVSVMAARKAAASTPDDPTWLAYTVYGDPRATISRPRMRPSISSLG